MPRIADELIERLQAEVAHNSGGAEPRLYRWLPASERA